MDKGTAVVAKDQAVLVALYAALAGVVILGIVVAVVTLGASKRRKKQSAADVEVGKVEAMIGTVERMVDAHEAAMAERKSDLDKIRAIADEQQRLREISDFINRSKK